MSALGKFLRIVAKVVKEHPELLVLVVSILWPDE